MNDENARWENIGWGCSTRISFSKEEFKYIYDLLEKPSGRDIVVVFDTVWSWQELGDSMREHPGELLRWIDRICCAIKVHGRNEQDVFDAVWGNFTKRTYSRETHTC